MATGTRDGKALVRFVAGVFLLLIPGVSRALARGYDDDEEERVCVHDEDEGEVCECLKQVEIDPPVITLPEARGIESRMLEETTERTDAFIAIRKAIFEARLPESDAGCAEILRRLNRIQEAIGQSVDRGYASLVELGAFWQADLAGRHADCRRPRA